MTESHDHTVEGQLTDRLRRASAPGVVTPDLPAAVVSEAPARRRVPRMVNHGLVARAASASLVAVAAVAVGSLVIVNPFAARAPLFAAAAGGGAATEAASMSSDSKIGWWVDYEYLAGEGLSTSGGRGSVYQLQRVGDPQEVLQGLAFEFGLSGDAVKSSYFDPAYPTYVIGSEDGTVPTMSITGAGTGNWWYNDPTAYPPSVCAPVTVESESGPVTFEECTQPEVPSSESLAPSEAEARSMAADLLAASGLDVEADDITIVADPWMTMATAHLFVDGVATAIDYGIGWTTTGEIAWAYGHSIEVVERGVFDTVSASSAVDRLDDWRWFGGAGPDYQGGATAFAADAGVSRGTTEAAVEPTTAPVAEPGDEPVVTPTDEPIVAPTDEPIIEPAPEPMPEPDTITVTLEKAEATLLLMWDADGNAWLVPGYAMQNPDGYWNSVVSLVEGVIELPEPILFDEGVIEPMPAIED